MINNFNLIIVTDEAMILENTNELSLSLAMGIISAYLEEKNIKVSITDTNKKANNNKYSKSELELISTVYDKEKILNYIRYGEDSTLDKVAEMFIDKDMENFDSYGISVGADFSLMQINLGFILAAYIKRTTSKPVIIGGNNISYIYIFKDIYKELLEAIISEFKFVIKGPGEDSIWKIIDGINKEKENSYFDNIGGLLRIVDNEIIANKEQDPTVTCPNWDSIDIMDYSSAVLKNQRENENIYYRFPLALTKKVVAANNTKEIKVVIPYIFNYNCTYKCAFCTQSDTDRSGLIVGEVKKVVDNIEYLSKKYNSNYFYFLNNYFPSSMQYITAFRDELKQRNLKIYWSDCGRVNGLTLEKLQLLHECGCRKLVFGFETGNFKILELIDKRLNLKELINVLTWCKQVGIWADLEVIIGLPYEREEEFMSTYKFLDEHRELVNNFWLNEYFVVPNSLIGKYPERYGIELLKNNISYEEIMLKNKKGFLEKNYVNLTANARLWGFNETNENDFRNYKQMRVENYEKINRLSQLRNPEFNKLFDFYTKMLSLRTGKGGS